MKVAVDLHIHSALSPCSDDEMTPNNIVNMACLKGLDIIAITDHNTVENCEAVIKCAKGKNILVIPGMEVETREEVHVLCLFSDIGQAFKMQDIVYEALPQLENREEIFGKQLIMDEKDNIKGICKSLLLTAVNLSIEEVFSTVTRLGGTVIPAHIDRGSYSILSNFGIIPETLDINYVELSKMCDDSQFKLKHPELNSYKFITSSDAHSLGDILERRSFLELPDMSTKSLISALGSDNQPSS